MNFAVSAECSQWRKVSIIDPNVVDVGPVMDQVEHLAPVSPLSILLTRHIQEIYNSVVMRSLMLWSSCLQFHHLCLYSKEHRQHRECFGHFYFTKKKKGKSSH